MTDDIDRARNQNNLHELERLAREAREQRAEFAMKAGQLAADLRDALAERDTAIAERDDWTRVAGHLGEAYQKACDERDEARRLLAEADRVIADLARQQDMVTEKWERWNERRQEAIARHAARKEPE